MGALAMPRSSAIMAAATTAEITLLDSPRPKIRPAIAAGWAKASAFSAVLCLKQGRRREQPALCQWADPCLANSNRVEQILIDASSTAPPT